MEHTRQDSTDDEEEDVFAYSYSVIIQIIQPCPDWIMADVGCRAVGTGSG